MKTYFLLIVIPFLYCCCKTKGQEIDNTKQKETAILFQKIENKMQSHYDHLNKNRLFEDPSGRIVYFFKTVKETAPQLFSDIKFFKDELLILLTDSSFQKNEYTDLDIVYLLYNLQINDYVDILEQISKLYKQNDVDYKIFDCFIFQDFNVSNSVAKNYRNEKLQNFLNSILQDEVLMSKSSLQNKLFKQALFDLKTGNSWNGTGDSFGLKKINEIQPPILETLK